MLSLIYLLAFLSLIMMWFAFGSVSGILIRILIPIGKPYEQQWISIITGIIQFVLCLL